MIHLQKYGDNKIMETTIYARRIRDLREDSDKTQQQIADYLGTSQTMYTRYERGANELPVRHLISLCKYYNVSADFILGLSNQKIRLEITPNTRNRRIR